MSTATPTAGTTARPQAEAVIDLDAVAHNVRVLTARAGSADVMAVVKADGYNHGAVPVARAALGAGAAELGVATVQEALALRAAGVDAPVLCWLHAPGADFRAAIEADVEIGVSTPRQIAEVVDAARTAGRRATVSVKLDTGMNRGGLAPDMVDEALDLLSRERGALDVRGAFSHLVAADDPEDPVTDLQKRRFDALVDAMTRAGVAPRTRHLANSAATLLRPDLAYDLVRPGIAVYGLSPAPDLGSFDLRPVMTVRATVVLLKNVPAGGGVGYGHQWIAPRDTVVALIPLGYADGVVRGLTGRYEVAVRGRRHRAVGRVSMDQVVIDVGPDGDVEVGDDAYFFGPGDHGESSAQDWAEVLDTINYEVVTGVRGRVERTYRGGVA
ncbi:alanine racemase [Rhodococcoides corynebacterioides]|uniref:alanine racemase n=1 Tax=Rhodococcoides corynebacterioides TaxID=53972 RepID=UPI0027E06A18|nr:alanine racemase [Rhodococcus corynebacterioides]